MDTRIPDTLLTGLCIELDALEGSSVLDGLDQCEVEALFRDVSCLEVLRFGDEDIALEIGLRVGIFLGTADGLAIPWTDLLRAVQERRAQAVP
jgi:hypothetical protein